MALPLHLDDARVLLTSAVGFVEFAVTDSSAPDDVSVNFSTIDPARMRSPSPISRTSCPRRRRASASLSRAGLRYCHVW
jgi:hypothetical protein